MFIDMRYALPIARPYSSSLPFHHDVRCAMTIRIHTHTHTISLSIEIRFSTIPSRYANQGFVDGSPSLKRRQKSSGATCDEARETAMLKDTYRRGGICMGQWPRSHCPAVMTTTVRRFPLGMTIDDRGLRASDFFLVSFFFFLLYFVRCRHRSGGNENLIGGVFVHSPNRPAPLRHRECKGGKETGDGGWTERTGVNRLNLPTPV